MAAVAWLLMMLVWLAALAFGLWWLWPTFLNMAPAADLVAGAMWLVIGFAAWLLALNLGWQRYGPRRGAARSVRRPGGAGRARSR